MMPGAVLAPRDRAKIINSKPDHDLPRMQTRREKKSERDGTTHAFPHYTKKSYKRNSWESVLKFRPCAEEGKRGGRKGNKGGPTDRPSGAFSFSCSLQCVVYVLFSFFSGKKKQPEFEFGKKRCAYAWVHLKAFEYSLEMLRNIFLTRGISGALANVPSAHCLEKPEMKSFLPARGKRKVE